MPNRTKQRNSINVTQQLEMTLDGVDPTQLTEERTLMMILCVYQADNLIFDARTVVANHLKRSETHLSHCVSGSAKLGDEDWERVISLCGEKARKIRNMWLDELKRRYAPAITEESHA